MKFSFFHFYAYTGNSEPAADWPIPNKTFDPKLGNQLINSYMNSMVTAEQVGFDWLGVNEHHMSPYGLGANPSLLAASLINRTDKAFLAVMGQLVPLLNPIRVAEEYAMLDVMSNGRLVAGLLRGIPHEYVAYNIPPDESYGRFNEAIELIQKAWTEPEPFGWEGEYYQYRAVSIWPKPMQKPHPKILMSGSNEVSARNAARKKAILGIANLTSIDNAKQLIKVYKEEAKYFGWEPSPSDILIAMNTSIDDDIEIAKSRLAEGRKYFAEVLGGGIRTAQKLVLQKSRYMDEDTKRNFVGVNKSAKIGVDELIESGTVVCGTPEQAVQQIKNCHAELGHGITNLVMKIGNITDKAVNQQLNIFGKKILPRVSSL